MIRAWHAQEQPFFRQVSHYAVHTPIQAIEEVAAKYEREGKNTINARDAAMVESVDDSMRQNLATLKEPKIEEDALIIFTQPDDVRRPDHEVFLEPTAAPESRYQAC